MTPNRWFPPERGPALVIGNPASVFTQHLARLWRSMGIDARILTRRWAGPRVLPDGTRIEATADTEQSGQARRYDWLERITRQIEARTVRLQNGRYARAMGSETSYRPYVSPCLADGFAIAHAVRRMRPQFVCGQEAFSYGLATALSRGVPRILMPWGGDVYMYADTTTLASAMVRYALNNVDLVVPGSSLARDYLHARFGVPVDHIHCGGLWVVDRSRFRRADPATRAAVCARFAIDPNRLIVMNIRRFFPAWGSDLALNAFIRFAQSHATSHFVLLGGAGTDVFVDQARVLIRDRGLTNRFTVFDGDIPLDACADLMSVTDIAVSLMRERDMRPLASILEAAASGAALVLGDQDEYRAMERLGFRAMIRPTEDEHAVVEALRTLEANRLLRAEVAAANLAYLDQHENGERQAIALLQRVRAVCDTYERH